MSDDLTSFPVADDGTFRAMRAIVGELARGVVGREDVVRAVQAAAAAGKGRTVLVVGDAGSGKTAALAALAAREPVPAAVHIVGRELGCDDPRLVVRALAAQLGVSPVPEEYGEAIAAFHGALDAVGASGKRAIVVVDGLDRLRGAEDGAASELLPSTVPDGVLLVLSSRPGAVADAIAKMRGVGRLALAPLKDDARLAVARAVAPDRSDEALASAAQASNGSPLFLRAILLASDGQSNDAPAATPEVAFGRTLNRIARGKTVEVPRALGLLAASRSGLTRADLASLLASPPSPIDELLADASPWLRERDGRVTIADARVRDWLLADVIGPVGQPALHSVIADRLAAGAASSRADALVDLTAHLEAASRAAEIPGLIESGRFPRLKAAAANPESLRDDLVRAARASGDDVVRAARFGLAAALLGGDAGAARAVRVKTLAAAARVLPKKDAWELAERATHEAFTETDPARRDTLVVAAVAALRTIDGAEARRVASGQPRGAARVRALVAAGELVGALAEADEAPEAEREEALAAVLEPMATTDPEETMKLLTRLHDAARRDRVLVALVAATKGIFLAGKIHDAVKRATALARIGEWDEAELAAADCQAGAARAAAHERIAVAARAAKEDARAVAHEAHAKKARDAIAAPVERAASLLAAASIAIDWPAEDAEASRVHRPGEGQAARARALVDEAIKLDAMHGPTRDALVLRARTVIAKPTGPELHDVIVALAPLGSALADVYPDIVAALALAFVARYPEAARAAVDGVDWADRFVSSLRAPASSQTVKPPPLAPTIARAVAKLPWTASPPADAELVAIEQRVQDDTASPQDIDRLVDARLSSGDRTAAVGALLQWASRLRAKGDRVDAAAAEERARAIDPVDPRHPPASMRPPSSSSRPRAETPATAEAVDEGWDDDPDPHTVREDVPRGVAPWSGVAGPSPMAESMAMAPTVPERTATILGIAAVPSPPAPDETPLLPDAPIKRPVLEKTMRSADGIAELIAAIEPARIDTLAPAAPTAPPPPAAEDEVYAEDEADQTSIMGAAERKALQRATRTGDAGVLKEAAEKIAADRDAEERALARATESHETARKLLAARDVDSPEAHDRPTKPPAALDAPTPALNFPPSGGVSIPTPPLASTPSSVPPPAPTPTPLPTPPPASARARALASARAPAPPAKQSSPIVPFAIVALIIAVAAFVARLLLK